jgi:hypothetical protein
MFLTLLKGHKTFHFLEGQLQQLLALLQVDMFSNLRVFPGERLYLLLGEVAAESVIQLSGELWRVLALVVGGNVFQGDAYVVVEFREQLHIKEQYRGRRQLLRDDIEEDLGTVVFIVLVGALLTLEGIQAHLQELSPVTQEQRFSACRESAFNPQTS